ncbi:hypothetical protein FACS18949_03300 [Clostridia bacterium]|nr:hypothetical protein FACS18949_03300 [Clostridia bacterium]
MVKGISKRVVLVRFPDTRVFEQAIFIVRDDGGVGVSAAQLVDEACVVADSYVKHGRGKHAGLPPAVFAAGGAAATGLAWLLWIIL